MADLRWLRWTRAYVEAHDLIDARDDT